MGGKEHPGGVGAIHLPGEGAAFKAPLFQHADCLHIPHRLGRPGGDFLPVRIPDFQIHIFDLQHPIQHCGGLADGDGRTASKGRPLRRGAALDDAVRHTRCGIGLGPGGDGFIIGKARHGNGCYIPPGHLHGHGQKFAAGHAVLDPELTVGLPPHTTATTGMDALAHAVEAYTNGTYNTRVENDLARKAVRLIHDNILTAVDVGTDLEARRNMQLGAFYAGRAFTRGCVGYVHAIGHTIGSLYGVSHGLAMAVLLPKVMRSYGDAVHRRLAQLAEICGMSGSNDAEKAEAFLTWIEETNRKMGLPDHFDMIRDEDIDRMVSWAMKEANPLYPVPVIWDREDFRAFIRSLR